MNQTNHVELNEIILFLKEEIVFQLITKLSILSRCNFHKKLKNFKYHNYLENLHIENYISCADYCLFNCILANKFTKNNLLDEVIVSLKRSNKFYVLDTMYLIYSNFSCSHNNSEILFFIKEKFMEILEFSYDSNQSLIQMIKLKMEINQITDNYNKLISIIKLLCIYVKLNFEEDLFIVLISLLKSLITIIQERNVLTIIEESFINRIKIFVLECINNYNLDRICLPNLLNINKSNLLSGFNLYLFSIHNEKDNIIKQNLYEERNDACYEKLDNAISFVLNKTEEIKFEEVNEIFQIIMKN